MGARLSALWAQWQFVIYLLVALALSIALNVHQWKQAITAPLRDQVSGLEKAQATAAGLIADGQTRERARLDAEAASTANLNDASARYRKAAATHPLAAVCAPGQGRIDATNQALGAKRTK